MNRPSLNVDLGERGEDHPVDLALLNHADLANIACGGHAGSADQARIWAQRATVRGVGVTAHLSYPDRENFGRAPMTLPPGELFAALAEQRAALPGVRAVKLHGALYHAADRDAALAEALARWLRQAGFARVLTPAGGELATFAAAEGLAVVAEAFAERRYRRDPDGRLGLVPRSQPGAVLHTVPEAMAQVERLLTRGTVRLHPGDEEGSLTADTLCVHGDAAIALPLAAALAARLREIAP